MTHTSPPLNPSIPPFLTALARFGHDTTRLLDPTRSPIALARRHGIPEADLTAALQASEYPVVFTLSQRDVQPGMHYAEHQGGLIWAADDPFDPETQAIAGGNAGFYALAHPRALPPSVTAPSASPLPQEQPTTIMQALHNLGYGEIQMPELYLANYHSTLLAEGRITEEELARAYAHLTQHPYIDVRRDPPHQDARHVLSTAIIRKQRIIPHTLRPDGILVVLTSNPTDHFGLAAAEDEYQHGIHLAVTPAPDLERLISELYDRPEQEAALDREAAHRRKQGPNTSDDFNNDPDNAIVQRVEAAIRDAAANDASDLHFQPEKGGMKVRERIHGNLIDRGIIPEELAPQMINRIKLIAGMPQELKIPQDKRIVMSLSGPRNQELRLRVSSLPSNYGDSIVMRLLRDVSTLPDLQTLPFSERNRDALTDALASSSGMVLVTGPTGSGKTTLMHTILRAKNEPTIKILAIEDPIEYEQPGIVQTEIRLTDDPTTSLTFARVLRSQLRQDPDIIFVGEIRDTETANVAVQASQTGHLLLSTLHTNTALATVSRLMDLGLPPYLIAESLRAVVAQRLVGMPCPDCSVIEPMPEEFREAYGPDFKRGTGLRATGGTEPCPVCHGTGTHRRIAIHEVLRITDEAREAIHARDLLQLLNVAKGDGFTPLRHDGLTKVAAHQADLASVLEATQ